MRCSRLIIFAIILPLLSSCAKARPRPSIPTPSISPAFIEIGLASWYGYPYHGRVAANGEVYDMEELTAAHRTLPFGTRVHVINLTNQRSIDVRINDRGPFVDGRVIDLSRAAARAIDLLGPGVARVRLEILGASVPLPAGEDRFAVQAGAFRERANADRFRSEMERRYGSARVVSRDGSPRLYRVLVGEERTLEGVQSLAERVRGSGGGAFIVRIDP